MYTLTPGNKNGDDSHESKPSVTFVNTFVASVVK
jgi:hypothetical protein